MTRPDPDPAAALGQLLKAERQALLAGDLAALPALVAGKERLLTELEASPRAPTADALEALRTAARDNQVLLDAALRGVRAAQARLEVARGGGAALSTYDARGKAESHAAPRTSFERRA